MFLRHNWLGIGWALFILVLCALPGGQFEKSTYVFADKVIHTFLYAVLFLLLSTGFIKQSTFQWLRTYPLQKVFAISTVYGLVIEVLQGLIFSSRSIEGLDVIANMIGSFIGLVIFFLVYGREDYT